MVTTSTARVLMAIWFTIFSAVGVLATTIAAFSVKTESQMYAWFGMIPSGLFMILSLCCICNCIDFPSCLIRRWNLTYNGDDDKVTGVGFDYASLNPPIQENYPRPVIQTRLQQTTRHFERETHDNLANGYKICSENYHPGKSINRSHSSAFCVIKSPEEIRAESQPTKLYATEKCFTLSGSGNTNLVLGAYDHSELLGYDKLSEFENEAIHSRKKNYGTMNCADAEYTASSSLSSVDDGFFIKSSKAFIGHYGSPGNVSVIVPTEKSEESSVSAEILVMDTTSSEDIYSDSSPKTIAVSVHRDGDDSDVSDTVLKAAYKEILKSRYN